MMIRGKTQIPCFFAFDFRDPVPVMTRFTIMIDLNQTICDECCSTVVVYLWNFILCTLKEVLELKFFSQKLHGIDIPSK